MKKCIVISDSFKGTLSSMEICRIARDTVPVVFPECEVVALPVADGGEGTVDCFVEAIGAEKVTAAVTGPYGEPISAAYARKGRLAVVEMASVAGLPMVGERKDPSRTTTCGVGQLIRHAVENGCTEILLGLGGSCTNDGGCGCAAALGVQFFDEAGKVIPVTITTTYRSAISNGTWVQNAPTNGTASVTVTDTKLIVPQTGGYVMYLYIAGAASLVLGGVMLVIIKRSKKNK